MSAVGALAFARYAFPPNELGFCGPLGARAMLDPGAVEEIERRARQFEGAWVYLEFLADALGAADPLAPEVVEAYWIGTDLLEGLSCEKLLDLLIARFGAQPGGTWREASQRARAHHSFQVFEVYPWAMMLRQGMAPEPAVGVLDGCRIRSGVVTEVVGEWVSVIAPQLSWDGRALVDIEGRVSRARWSVDGLTLLAPPAVGDTVALHWDWVCDVLTTDQVAQMNALEARQRQAVGLSGQP